MTMLIILLLSLFISFLGVLISIGHQIYYVKKGFNFDSLELLFDCFLSIIPIVNLIVVVFSGSYLCYKIIKFLKIPDKIDIYFTDLIGKGTIE